MIAWMNETLPWWGWLIVAYTVGGVAFLGHLVKAAPLLEDEEFDESFLAWCEDTKDLELSPHAD